MYRGIIYKITHNETGKQYIGQTTKPLKRRISHHKTICFSNSKIFNNKLYELMRLYKKDEFDSKFTVEIIEQLEDTDKEKLKYNLLEREQYYIQENNTFIDNNPNGLNMTTGGLSPKVCEATKKDMSNSRTGDKHPMFGKKHDEAIKKKISDSLTGDKHPMFGKKHDEAAKKKISDSMEAYWAAKKNKNTNT